MSLPSLVALLLTLTGIFAYLNDKVLRLPLTVGLMGSSLAASLILILAERLGLPLHSWAVNTISHVDFSEALLDGMLSFLLFAGALHVDLGELREQKITVAILATGGVLLSTALAGGATWIVFHWLRVEIPLIA